MNKFKTGDRVRVVMPDDRKEENSPYDGAIGEVTAEPESDGDYYTVVLDNIGLGCRLWGEQYLEAASFEIGTLVEVTDRSVTWNGAVGSIYMTDKVDGVYIKLVEKYKNFKIGTELYFRRDQLSPTSIPVEDPSDEAPVETPKSKQVNALTMALLAFEYYATQHEAKGKTKKARTNRILADMMQEALDDIE